MFEYSHRCSKIHTGYFIYWFIDSSLGSFSDHGKKSSTGTLFIFSIAYSRYLSAYQIANYYKGKHSADSLHIKKWIKEGKNYIKSIDKNGKLNIDYFKQNSELDAYAFSYAVMKYKYNSRYDSELYVPPIYKEEMKEGFEMMVKDFLNYFAGIF